MSKNSHVAFIDPIGAVIVDPVIMRHPNFAPYIYERASLLKACEDKAFTPLGLFTDEQLKPLLLPAQFVRALLLYMQDKETVSDVKEELEDLYHSPIDFQFPMDQKAYLCRQDGQTYVESEARWFQKTPYSPITYRAVLNNDFILDNIALHLVQQYNIGKRNLKEIFKEWRQDTQPFVFDSKKFSGFYGHYTLRKSWPRTSTDGDGLFKTLRTSRMGNSAASCPILPTRD